MKGAGIPVKFPVSGKGEGGEDEATDSAHRLVSTSDNYCSAERDESSLEKSDVCSHVDGQLYLVPIKKSKKMKKTLGRLCKVRPLHPRFCLYKHFIRIWCYFNSIFLCMYNTILSARPLLK